MRAKHLIRDTASAIVLIGLSAGGSAYAQDQVEDIAVGELIVTAQKREQRLQDVPIVVTVATAQLIEDAGIKDIRDLSILAPGLTVTSTSSEASVTARIRGIGTVGDNPGLESSVGIVIDGVYRPRNGVGFGDLGDVSRIEILKGPQGTLFGKNTSAGVINVVTKEPSFNKGGDFEFTMGDYHTLGGSMNLTGPIIADKLAGSFFAASRIRDGFMDVQTLGSGAKPYSNDQEYFTTRAQLLALPNDRLSARIIVDYTHRDEHCCAATQLFVGASPTGRGAIVNVVKPGGIDLTSTPFDRLAYSNRDFIQKIEDMGLSGEATYDINDNIQLTSVSAWRSNELRNGSDADYTAADLIYIPGDGSNNTRFKQLSQELRLAGEHGRLNWLVGIFAAKEDLDNQAVLNYGTDFYAFLDQRVLGNFPASTFGLPAGSIHRPGIARIDKHSQQDKTFAVFTNNDYKVTDRLTATLGLRYTRDEKSLASQYTTFSESCQKAESAPAGASPALAAVVGGLCVPFMNADFDALGVNYQTNNEEKFSGTAKLAYRWHDQFMTYVSGSRGYKAGGFNLDRESVQCAANGTAVNAQTNSACPVAGGLIATGRPGASWVADPDTSFSPETVDSYELGTKTQWLDNTLVVNVSLFHQKFTDFQLNTFAGTQFVVVTLPEVTSKGIDMDFLWSSPIEGLRFQGGGTIADTIIGRYTGTDFKNYSDFLPVAHMQDRRLSFAPKYTASLAATYETPILDNKLIFRSNVSAKYNSAYNTGSDLNSAKVQKEFTVVNARIGIGLPDDSVRIELWSQNLFDQDYLQVGFNGTFQVPSTAPAFIGQDPGIINNPSSVFDAFLGAPRTVGLTLRAKLR